MTTPGGPLSRFVALCSHYSIPGWLIAALLVASSASAQVDVLTNRYNGKRTGANLSETTLRTDTVSVDQFGKLYSYPVDGSVYAQPLYVPGVMIDGTPRNVLYVATMNDKVYAFDADSSSPTPLWTRDFTNPPSVTAIPITDVAVCCADIIGNVGIQSTPVIGGNTIYLVARTKENGEYVQRLHALDIATGSSKAGSGRVITGSAAGTAPDAVDGRVTFNPKTQSQRAALALTNGVVLISWASHMDALPYHGWIMGYDATSLAQVGVFLVSPTATAGGIWQGGRGPTIDADGNAYFATGNGKWDGLQNWGDSLLKFSVSTAGLSLLDWFTPYNEATLSRDDDDLSGSGFTMLPGNLLLGGGKEGVLYLLDANNLGHKASLDGQIPHRIPVQGGHVMGGVVYWTHQPATGAETLVYNWSEDDVLKTYKLTNRKLELPADAQGLVMSPGHPGGSLTLSANGASPGTGIVWASMPTNRDGLHGLVAGILRAFDAETLRELWNSEENPTRDRVGTLMKFVPPVVVNGKVYMPSHDGTVSVYGLLPVPTPDFSVSVAPSSKTVTSGGSATFSVSITPKNGFAGTVSLSAKGQPAGGTANFTPSSVSGSGTSTLTVSIPAGAAGTFPITVTGVSGSLSRKATATVVAGIAPPSGTIGINFVGTAPSPMTSGEMAGVVLHPNWNNAAGVTRATPLALVDNAGAATGATVTWTAAASWATPIIDSPGNKRMMKGYLDTSNTSTTTVKVAGLPQRAYDVYVYADGANNTASRTAAYTISGTGITSSTVTLTDAANTNFTAAFTRASNSAGNYVKFTIDAGGFTLSVTPTAATTTTRRAPINAIQIVPAGPATADFSVSVSPASRSVTPGGSTTYTATITPSNGFTGTVALTVSGVPSGTTATFSPTTVTGSGTATLTVSTSASTPSGNSTLTIKGTSGSLSHSDTGTLAVGSAGGKGSGSIGINFVGRNSVGMAATETAGVVTQPNWNNATGGTGSTPLALADRSGAATSATVTWSAAGVWSTPITDAAGNARLMKGYLDTTNTSTTTVRIAGLAQGTYDVYVYADGDNKAENRTAAYTISGTGITTTTINLIDAANTNYASSYTRANNSAGNYVKFTVNATAFTIAATPAGAAATIMRAPVNGIQIVPVVPVVPSRIGINFVGTSPTLMAASESAGVVPQTNWNNASGATRTTPLALRDQTGATSAATVTWTAFGTWMLPITDGEGNGRLMKGYLDTSSTSSTTVSVAGLPSGDYDVYVYVDGDNHGFTRTAAYRVAGSGSTASTVTVTDAANTDFSGTFTEAADTNGNYARFSISGTGFTLTATPTSGTNTTLRAPVNAIQIVPKVP